MSMTQCKCEHWQICPTCQPKRFDTDGNMLPPEPTPLQAARAQINADEALLRQAYEALKCIDSPMTVKEINTVGAAQAALRQRLNHPTGATHA